MVSTYLIGLAIINFIIACIIFFVGRSIHECSHFLIAKYYELEGLKVDFNIFREPLKGAKVIIPDEQYFRLSKNNKFFLLISGIAIQYPFYIIIWFIVNNSVQSFEFKFLFSLVMLILIIPDIIINTVKHKGDIYRLLRL